MNALTPNITEMPFIYEAIERFCEVKTSIDPSSRYNVSFFEENGPNYLEDFTLNSEHILLTLKSLEPVIIGGNIGGGIFVGISFIIQAFKIIGEKAFRLIVFSDAYTPKIAPVYLPVLQNLISQVKDMPLFIDIIRIKIKDPEEDEKLQKLVKRCNGEILYVEKLNELPQLLETLALKKKIKRSSLEDGKYIIPQDSHLFYINLAEDLAEVKKHDTCSICFEKDATDLLKCKKCGTKAHRTCWAQWAPETSIGIPHVFRCFNCYNLIRLDREYIEKVKFTKAMQRDIRVELLDIQDYLKSHESQEAPQVIQAENVLGISTGVSDANQIETPKTEDIKKEIKDEELKFILCPHCYKMITNEYKICPACHKTIK
ncbi:MAG: hypothetical protein EU529_13265 [Promethearchaeota archaeon]|nr:MAG: hypothetical protein EU529_13265 [Candidatus Lokiarchaeota archaeon]